MSASGLSCSGLKSQKRRLVGVGLRQTQGGHHLNSAVQKFLEMETLTLVRSPQVESSDEGIQKTGHEDELQF